jgi:gamma-glutamylcyclotransferase
MSLLSYLAYGSNLHPLRLGERVPSAELVGLVRLVGYRVAFHKRGRDGSAKCDLVRMASPGDLAYGAVYRMVAAHKVLLDRCEGLGRGYTTVALEVPGPDGPLHCFTYVAQDGYRDPSLRPFDWYRALVLLGGRRLGMPDDYLAGIAGLPDVRDPDEERRSLHEALIEKIRRADAWDVTDWATARRRPI